MSSAAQQFDLPKTAQGAPPSFYNQAAQMQTGGGAAAGNQQAGNQPAQPDADTQKFTEMEAKLLTVLESMRTMKPNGVDVSKYIQAAADAVKQASKAAQGGEKQQPAGTTPAAADSGTMPGDQTAGNQGAAVAGQAAAAA